MAGKHGVRSGGPIHAHRRSGDDRGLRATRRERLLVLAKRRARRTRNARVRQPWATGRRCKSAEADPHASLPLQHGPRWGAEGEPDARLLQDWAHNDRSRGYAQVFSQSLLHAGYSDDAEPRKVPHRGSPTE